MSKIVVHHAHHADEGLFRLVIAEEIEHVRLIDIANPDFDEDEPVTQENQPTLIREERLVTHARHQEVVWDANDERWKDRKPESIAAEQRAIVKGRLDELDRAAEKAAENARRAHPYLGGVGERL